MFKVEGLDHVALAVRDIERSVKWYADVLGFKREHEGRWGGVPVFVGNGSAAIALFPVRQKTRSTIPDRAPERILHFAFRANRENFLRAQNELKKRAIALDFQDHDISHSIYFCDPDGHKIEITTYEV